MRHDNLRKSLALIIRMVRFDFVGFFRSPRWLILPAGVALIAWIQGATVVRSAAAAGRAANVWDGVGAVMLNRFAIWYFMTPIYLYLINDLILDRGFGPALQLRTQSRSGWWIGKVAALMGLAVMGGVACLSISILVNALMLPWDSHWSEFARFKETAAPALLASSPLQVVVGACALMALGWWLFALVGAVATMQFRHAWSGFTVGFGFYYVGIALEFLVPTNRISQWFPHVHFTLNELSYQAGRFDLAIILGSVGYLLLLSAAAVTVGRGKIQDRDFPITGG